MLLTPLLPRAGPTGGEGDACPAPTINLTIWSFWIAFLAIAFLVGVESLKQIDVNLELPWNVDDKKVG